MREQGECLLFFRPFSKKMVALSSLRVSADRGARRKPFVSLFSSVSSV